MKSLGFLSMKEIQTKHFLPVLLLFFLMPLLTFGQKTVSGTIVSSDGEPMIGANVLVKGTDLGTITDISGRYTIEGVPDASDVLVVSFIGYATEELIIDNRNTVDVLLTATASQLEELVVVGYGTQKKVNLTGAVSSMNVDHFEGRPITQASQALAGEISGVSVRQVSGAPGFTPGGGLPGDGSDPDNNYIASDKAEIRIRGLGTFSSAGNDPFILVDGINMDIDEVNPNDIASVSVLKDAASASIYGSRAANGVILITTKKGQRDLQVHYDGYVGKQTVMEFPKYLPSWEQAGALNEAQANNGLASTYTAAEIELFRNGSDPDNYPNNDHVRNIFSTGSGLQTTHNLSVSGGSDRSTYWFSTRYQLSEGFIDHYSNNRFDYNLKINTDISEKFNLEVGVVGNKQKQQFPLMSIPGLIHGEWHAISYWLPPSFPTRRSDGSYGNYFNRSPYAVLDEPGLRTFDKTHTLARTRLSYQIIEPLTLRGEAAYKTNTLMDVANQRQYQIDATTLHGTKSTDEQHSNENLLLLRAIIEFNKELQNHDINIIAGIEQEEWQSNFIKAFRGNQPTNELHELNSGDAATQTNNGNTEEYALRSYFGRFQYAFKGKYLLEGSLRYDGSSRFSEGNRFGVFPSVSGAWRISEEDFFPETSWIDHLKVRASWGKLGNQKIGLYPYQQTLSTGQQYFIGDALSSGARVTRVANQDITWESTTVTDVGLDVTLFDGKLDVYADYFYKKTDDILYNISVVNLLGLSASPVNAGAVENKGFEIYLNHRNSIGDFQYSITPNFSYITNKVTALANVDQDIANGLFVGEPLESVYGYVWDGWFLDQEDIDSNLPQPYTPKPGQPRFVDISGPNGVPDGIVNATYDRKPLGSKIPKYIFGATFGAQFKGFDFRLLLQGEAGMKRQLKGLSGTAFHIFDSSVQRYIYDNRWTADNPQRYSEYGRLEVTTVAQFTTQNSSFWMRNASYLKVKNLQIGYTLPSQLTEAIKLSFLRVYLNASNLYSFDSYPQGWDPDEVHDDWFWGVKYPNARTFTGGLQVKF